MSSDRPIPAWPVTQDLHGRTHMDEATPATSDTWKNNPMPLEREQFGLHLALLLEAFNRAKLGQLPDAWTVNGSSISRIAGSIFTDAGPGIAYFACASSPPTTNTLSERPG